VSDFDLQWAGRLLEATRQAVGGPEVAAGLPGILHVALQAGLADAAGITEPDPDFVGSFTTSAASQDRVRAADRLQYEHRQGPCVDAAESTGIIVSADVAQDGRWPQWGPQARALGVHAVISVHLYAGPTGLGAVNLYSIKVRDFRHQDLAAAQMVGGICP